MKSTELKIGKYYKCDKISWLKNYKKFISISKDMYGGDAYHFSYGYILVITYAGYNDYNFIEKVSKWKDKIKE